MSVVVRQGEMRIERARRLMNERSGFSLVAWLVKDWLWKQEGLVLGNRRV